MQLYIGGLADDTAEADVEEIFPKSAHPNRSQLLGMLSQANPGGFAIAEIPSEEKGEEAIRHLICKLEILEPEGERC